MRFQSWMFFFCVLFGLALIAQTQSAGDGGWFLYAWFLHDGARLYSQMHLALQPVFVLETKWFLAAFGPGWIASKLPAVFHLVAYCIALRLLVRRSDFTDAQKAILFACGFFFPLGFEAYRFDDYHVLADCFELYSLVVLLALPKASKYVKQFVLVGVLGMFCGLSITTRLNDGAALFVGVALGIPLLALRYRLRSLALFCIATALTITLVVRLTGDSLHDYASYSIFHAASSKGGAGSVLGYPINLPLETASWLLVHWQMDIVIIYVMLCAIAWVSMLRPFIRRQGSHELVMAIGGATLILLPFLWLHKALLSSAPNVTFPIPLVSIAAILTLFAYMLGTLVCIRLFRWLFRSIFPYQWDRNEILLLIPIGQLASGSMSSAGTHLGLYGPLGVLIILLSIRQPVHFRTSWFRSFAIAVAVILVISIALFKARDPFSWHTYRERPLFVGRVLYRHPVYGPMIIDKDLLGFIQPVCDTINSSSSQPQLLSLPYSYANYFCAIPPWNGYVQTFFDTSSKETIQGLMDRLNAAPPTWILYQRQLKTLQLHEKTFNRGQPLQHRYLDQMIEQKIADGTWQVVYSSSYGDSPAWDNHWQLIRTTH